jgi:hypothetical protein
LDPNTQTSLQTTLAAEAHLADGQILLQKQTLNEAKSLLHPAGIHEQFLKEDRIYNQGKL